MFRFVLSAAVVAALTAPAIAQKKAPVKPAAGEDKYYRVVTLPVPDGIVLEVGGMGFTPDGRLMACTRRGEIWAIHNPLSEDPEKITYKLFARGLHETLGLEVVNDRELIVGQRGEITRIRDTDGDGEADDFETICNKWGISGDYHEYAFMGPKEKDGSRTVTLNRGFGGSLPGAGRPLYRGWAIRIRPDGTMEPYAYGLRSPCGVGLNNEGDLFYTDNQGSWMAVCPVFHLVPGEFYGETVCFGSLKGSPLDGKVEITSEAQLRRPGYVKGENRGWRYDGEPGPDGKLLYPPHKQPAVWVPYGKMCNSLGQPLTDPGGRFGPFAGQMFIGDQTKSNVIRVALEKVEGEYQGACFFFRGGLQCGVIRSCWAPDGSLFVGQTNRGWGSVGPKPYGIQRIIHTGETPMDIHTMSLTKTGFELTFTRPVDPGTAEKAAAYNMESYTYYYWSTYGSPEVDRRPEKVTSVKVSDDRRKVTVELSGIVKGRVYELQLDGVKSADGEPVLHPAGWYTVSHLRK
jgi:hypothetical protein